MTYLLDVNCLVALFDSRHVNHEAAHGWFARTGRRSWATCPITENGFVRVLSAPTYPTVTATPGEVIKHLALFCEHAGHELWDDDVSILSILDDGTRTRLTGHQQVTDFYLTALAAHHSGRVATFDGSLARSLKGTKLVDALEVITG